MTFFKEIEKSEYHRKNVNIIVFQFEVSRVYIRIKSQVQGNCEASSQQPVFHKYV